ncbi:MAG: hypothetical protein L0H31_17085 [Nocardioidaceae bacterium]|nr:hypothetical protein [Nocardioidaceae bacterium]
MSDVRGHLSDLQAIQSKKKARRVEANASTDAKSLAELACRRYQEKEQAKADELAAHQAEQEALRTEYLSRVSARGLDALPRLLAEKWDLPEEHSFVTTLDWELMTGCYIGATFTETPDGGIESQAAPDKRLEEVYETTIEGRRIQARVQPINDRDSMVTVSGVIEHGSRGLQDLVALGEFLSDPTTSGSTPDTRPRDEE